jgi:hypothetical protein
MAVAINWFEVLLPSNTLLVPTQVVDAPEGVPAIPGETPHRTVQRRRDENTVTIFHLCPDIPADCEPQPMPVDDEPNIVKLIIELAFAHSLRERGCLINMKHVGGAAYFRTEQSAAPDVYTFYKGIDFKCFFGFGNKSHRWGMVLNFATSQRFRISLVDEQLQSLAIDCKVVPLVGSSPLDEDGNEIKSGVLQQINGVRGVIRRTQGDLEDIDLGHWTLPCRKDALCNYLRLKGRDSHAKDARWQLDHDAHLVGDRGFMNTSLAKDQMREVQDALRKFALNRFALQLPTTPVASLVDRFLSIGATT